MSITLDVNRQLLTVWLITIYTDAGIHILRGIPRGNLPLNNGLIMSDNPAGNGFRFRIVCRSDSMSNNVGQFIGLDGTTALSNNSFFAIARRLPGELSVENVVGLQNALTVNQDGIYTCQTQLQNGEIRNINFGVYHNGFNSEFYSDGTFLQELLI